MKIDLTHKIRIAKRTKLGRLFCRLAGDRSGAVMMEYVILGVMIAAAATLAAIFFGKTLVIKLGIMNSAAQGQTDTAVQNSKPTDVSDNKSSQDARKDISGGGGNDANK